MSYIDREKLMEILHISDDCSNCLRSKYNGWCSEDNAFTWACECITNAPSADVEVVRRGRWEFDEPYYMFCCSICGNHAIRNDYPYCMWCGAKMDLDEVDE